MAKATPPLSPVLKHTTLTDCADLLIGLDQAHGLIPKAGAEQIQAAATLLLDKADSLGLSSLWEAIKHANMIIGAVCNLTADKLFTFQHTDTAEVVHLHRNVLLSLVLAGLTDSNTDVATALIRFPPLKARTTDRARAYTDDEILLLRLRALHLTNGNKTDRRRAAIYALCDAGIIAGETTKIQVNDIDLSPEASMVFAPGLQKGAGVGERLLELEPIHATLIGPRLRECAVRGNVRLTYAPRTADEMTSVKAYMSASASVTLVIHRFADEVDLYPDDITPPLDLQVATDHHHHRPR